MDYLYFKALHIIFVVTWFAGLFYIVRLLIYHTESKELTEVEKNILHKQFTIMEKRLWFGITWPSACLTITFGGFMLTEFLPLTDHPWLIVKLIFVACLFIYHLICGNLVKKIQNHTTNITSDQLRLFNEVATLFLISIVFLVVLKDIMGLTYGVLGLIVISILLMAGTKIYKYFRTRT